MVVGRVGKICFKFTFKNSQGHASTVAMSMYNDPIPTRPVGLTTIGSIVSSILIIYLLNIFYSHRWNSLAIWRNLIFLWVVATSTEPDEHKI